MPGSDGGKPPSDAKASIWGVSQTLGGLLSGSCPRASQGCPMPHKPMVNTSQCHLLDRTRPVSSLGGRLRTHVGGRLPFRGHGNGTTHLPRPPHAHSPHHRVGFR